MKKSLLIAFTFIAMQISAQSSQFPKINSIGQAIDQSGEVSMLMERVATMYAAQASEKLPASVKENSRNDQKKAQANINVIFNNLESYDHLLTKGHIQDKLTKAKDVWAKMGRALLKEPSAANLIDIITWSDRAVKANDDVTLALDKLADNPNAEIIDKASHQRIYAMKLARDYITASIGVDKENRINAMLETATMFESTMLVLGTSEINTSEVKGMINSITKMEWQHVYKSVTKCVESNGTEFNELIMLKFADTLLEKTEKLTHMYAALF